MLIKRPQSSFLYSSFVLLSFQFGAPNRIHVLLQTGSQSVSLSTTKLQGAGGILLLFHWSIQHVHHVEGGPQTMQTKNGEKCLSIKPAE